MTVTVSTGAAKPRQARDLINDVARSVGKENNANARSQARGYLNDIVNELNTYQPWQMLRAESTGNAFTDDTATYDLGFSPFKIEVVWIQDSDGTPLWPCDEIDYAVYRDSDRLRYPSTLAPYRAFFVRNLHADSTITFVGTPGTGVTETYNIGYIKRIDQLGNDASVLDIPREMDRVLVAGAKYLMRDNAPTADQGQVARSYADYQRLISRLRDIDRNHPAEHAGWRIDSRRGGNSTFPYFLIPFT